MATHTSNVKYASRSAVHGSNAYDLNRVRNAMPAPSEIDRTPVRRPEIRPAVSPTPKSAPKNTPKEMPGDGRQATRRAAQQSKTQKTYGVSLYAVTGFVVVAVLMVFVLLAHVRYAEVASETVKMQTQLTQLTEQERKLKIAYGNAFDVNQVEQYATHQLGMTKPSESQIGSISAKAHDKAVVGASQKNAPKQSENMATFLASLLVYFK